MVLFFFNFLLIPFIGLTMEDTAIVYTAIGILQRRIGSLSLVTSLFGMLKKFIENTSMLHPLTLAYPLFFFFFFNILQNRKCSIFGRNGDAGAH